GEFLIGFAAMIERLLAGADLARDEARSLGDRLLKGDLSPVQVGAVIAALRAKGERPYELAGLALACRDTLVPLGHERLAIDICGMAADGTSTPLVSVAAAF